MKGRRGPLRSIARPKPHVQAVVAYLKERGAQDVIVTQPKHYRIAFVLDGTPRQLTVATTPRVRCERHSVAQARQAIQRMEARP